MTIQIILLYLLGLIFLVFCNLFIPVGEQQFVLLAQSLLQGQLSLGPSSISTDASYYHGLAYWPQGVFPAMVLLPFVSLFQNGVQQGHVQFFLNLLNLFLLYKIAFKITHNHMTSLWLGFAYIFSTAYLVVGLFAWSWWYAHVVATTCLLLMLFEYFHARRWLLIGLYLACAMATRIDLLFALIFPLFMLIMTKETLKKKLIAVLFVCAPFFFGIGLIALYNYLRFGSVLEFGYTYHIPGITSNIVTFAAYGPWNLFYIPSNLYYLFLRSFDGVFAPGTNYLIYPFLKIDPWGMSIFLTSPILLWCLKTKKKELVVKASLLTALCILLFLLGYFGIGARQYGFRYALDFQPFLFILLCFAFQQQMSWKPKLVIILSFLLGLFLFPDVFTADL